MAFYLYHCQDMDERELALAIRQQHLQAHLDYVEAHIDRYAVAGPNRETGGEYRASTFVVRADDLADADALMAADPYVAAGLYRAVRGVEFVPVAGEWVGGIGWK